MKTQTLFRLASVLFAIMPQGPVSFTGSLCAADSGYQIVERGQDFAVVRKTIIIPDQQTPSTFRAGLTYYIKTSYSTGGSVYFEPGCVIKYKQNANLLLYGPITFPSAQPYAVFTSRNDNNWGDVIQDVPGEANSNGDPTLHKAAQAIWIYFVDFNTTIQTRASAGLRRAFSMT